MLDKFESNILAFQLNHPQSLIKQNIEVFLTALAPDLGQLNYNISYCEIDYKHIKLR